MSERGDRYDRQRRLPEVGQAGQSRISSLHAVVRGRDGAVVEAQYLHRAGVPSLLLVPGEPAEPFRHAEWFRSDAARSLGAGAWRALAKIRIALEIGLP